LQQKLSNPFNSSTAISFELPVSSFIKLSIYNVLGQNVNVLEDGYFEAGNHTVVWDGLDSEGNPMSSGVYFYRLQAKDFNDTKKMLLVK
jgi:flagellar hook assembly protein FlgD